MNNTLKIILIVTLALVVGAGLFLAGVFANHVIAWTSGYGPGMMGSGGYAPGGMMGGFGRDFDYGRSGRGFGHGGMMGGYGFSLPANTEPLTVEQTRDAVEAYLDRYGNDDLAIKEIMVFDNNAYAIVIEKSTGIGAFELLVDPVTRSVFPEYGPNMMWNLKYGMHGGRGGHGMMGGWYRGRSRDVSAEMPVSPELAAQYAQEYLDTYQPGVSFSHEITPFYGYYTIDLEKDGSIVGMLSVNGYSGQVFPHTWHGDFIEMSEE